MTDPTDTVSAPPLNEYLRGRDVSCPICAASLRDSLSTRCPKCREELQLALVSADPKIKLWLTCAVPLLLVNGVGVLVVVAILTHGLIHSRDAVPGYASLASIPFGIAAVSLRRRFNRLPLTTRRYLAAASVLYAVSLFALFLLCIP